MRNLLLLAALVSFGCGPATQAGAIPEYGYEVVHTYPHDPLAFTQGLFYLDGYLYEGTGLEGQSSIRKVRLETGEVLRSATVPEEYFGEGIVNWKDRLLELTWKAQRGLHLRPGQLRPPGPVRLSRRRLGADAGRQADHHERRQRPVALLGSGNAARNRPHHRDGRRPAREAN